MQLNCILFPGRKTPNITDIKDNIVLIPRHEHQSHLPYMAHTAHTTPQYNQVDHLYRGTPHLSSMYGKRNTGLECRTTKYTQQSVNDTPQIQQFSQIFRLKIQQAETHRDRLLRENTSLPLRDPTLTLQTEGEVKSQSIVKISQQIPCLYLPGTEKLIIYFHGNAQDLGSSNSFVRYINNNLGYSVIVMEYPGYSVYEGICSSDKIQRDCLQLMNYLLRIGYLLDSIFVIGRSIGTGPALFLCSYFRVKGLMLISPFLSVARLVRDKYGLIPSMLIKERFQNYKVIQLVDVPMFILHGLEDSIVPYRHASELQKLAPSRCHVKLVQKMTHTSFDFKNDFLEPLRSFLGKIQF